MRIGRRYVILFLMLVPLSFVTLFFNNCSGFESGFDSASFSTGIDNLGADSPAEDVKCITAGMMTYSVGQSIIGYDVSSVVSPATCAAPVIRTCLQSGKFDGPVPRFATCTVTAALPSPPVSSTALLNKAVEDMTLKNDILALNVNPGFDWAIGPKLGYASNPPADWTAMVPWGEVFMGQGNQVTDPYAEIRNIEVWVLRKTTGSWSLILQNPNFEGALFDPTYSNANRPATVSTGSEGGKKLRVEDWPFHFFPSRVAMPSDMGGLFVRAQTRLSPGTAGSAVVLIHMAADYWRNTSAPFAADYSNNGDAMISRLRRLTTSWEWVNAHSLTEAQLRANPPPFLK